MLEQYRTSSIEWKPSPVVALATSVDDSQVAAAREDGSLEIWLVSPGSVGWHCQLTIHGDPKSRITSLVWCRTSSKDAPSGRLFSSSIDGSVSEWDLQKLSQKVVLESVGASIWQMALEPVENQKRYKEQDSQSNGNGIVIDRYNDENGSGSSESDDDDNSNHLHEQTLVENSRIALACDDGCVRLYTFSDADELTYHRSLQRVSGRTLSVTWSPDGCFIYSGTSDGYIRCWHAKHGHEVYRITVGLGGSGSRADLCVWSLLALRCGVLVSADSTGSVQFWNIQHGTLFQAHSLHRGDAYALAAAPSHSRVFSAGSDGKVILYKLSGSASESSHTGEFSCGVSKEWVYVDSKTAHTHDIRALTVAVPICSEDLVPDEKVKKFRKMGKPVDFTYHKWAHLGVPMLLSAGDDAKIFAYSANEFTKFSPHDVCPAPQRALVHMVQNSIFNQMSLLLVQASNHVDILSLRIGNGILSSKASRGIVSTNLLARVNSRGSAKITCSAFAPSGSLFSFCNHIKPSLFELKSCKGGKGAWIINKRTLPGKLPYGHAMTFTFDSSRLILAGHDRRIYIIDVDSSELLHVFTPCRKTEDEEFPPSQPPITKLFTSSDGQWLAAVNCFGDIYVFNMEIQRQHWFISRLDGASVTAGGFYPQSNNVLIVTTSSNQVYAFDVEAKQLGEWSRKNSFALPRRFQEFPGEVIGLSFPPSGNSSSIIVYSSRAMCLIDFGMPVDLDDINDKVNGLDSVSRKLIEHDDSNNKMNGLDSVSRMLMDRDDSIDVVNGLDLVSKKLINSNGNLKRKLQKQHEIAKHYAKRNFEFFSFSHPVLFIGHFTKNSLLVVDKPWLEVLKNLDNQPVHRHIYGS